MKKKLLSAAVAAVMCFGICGCAADFDDVESNAWYAEGIDYVCDKGYFSGVSETEFAPNDSMTRAMFVRVLGAMAGIAPSDISNTSFSDVPVNAWYSPYVEWAANNGIVSGVTQTEFCPDDNVTREQMAVLIDRYMQYSGISLADNPNVSSAFSDADKISAWAYDSVELMRRTGIFSGDSENAFSPQSNATRAETASVIMRLDRAASGEVLEMPVPSDSQVDAIISQMSLEEKIYQLFITTPEQITGASQVTRAGETTKKALQKYPVAGLVYFKQNMIYPEQLKNMIEDSQSYAKLGMFISVDEEGGDVARIADTMQTYKLEPMYTYKDQGPKTAYDNAWAIAVRIKEFGFNLNYAPVADVWTDPDNKTIGTRAYSDDPQQAAELVGAAVNGFQEAGVMCTLKHFPGQGSVAADTHTGSAVSSKSIEELRTEEFLPFKAGINAGADFVMVSHVTVPSVDNVPASLSNVFIEDILRDELGFEGVVITDAMNMQAISANYTSADAAVRAINAGADIILMPDNLQEAAKGINDALYDGRITYARLNESLRRILTAKENYGLLDEQ